MKKIFRLCAAALFATSCNHAPQFTAQGTIDQAADSMLYLEANTLDGIQRIDSVRLTADGHFTLHGNAPADCPEFFALRIGNRRIHFSVDSTETITFRASLPTLTRQYEVEGSDNAQKIKEISLRLQALQKHIIDIENDETLLPGEATDSINALLRAYKDDMKQQYIYDNPRKAYAYFAVCQSFIDRYGTYQLFHPLSQRDDVKCYATVATAWDAQWPDAPRTIQLCNMAVKGMGNTAPVQTRELEIDESLIHETSIIQVELPDIDGNLHRLTDLKGKVVLLDFTLYGAPDSAKRTRIMRDIYNRYHARGLEIFQVSLDDDLHFWKYSVENLPWICVHETDGRATKSYAVFNLPAFFLINRQNEIVCRDDAIQDLDAAIDALL